MKVDLNKPDISNHDEDCGADDSALLYEQRKSVGRFRVAKPNIYISDGDCEADKDTPLADQKAAIQANEEKWLYWVRLFFLILAVLITSSVVLIYLWHLCAPECLRWLKVADLTKIKDLATTIIVGLVLSISTTFFFKKNN